MSKQVDSYVASMEFDNSKFEKNVATSMSTLEKLKQKLNFSGASKGLEEINAAAGKVNMSGLGSGVDAVKAKFSALDVVAVTALANITNKAVDAGEKLVKSLSVDQISSGWDKYAQKTTSVQTLVNSTGKSLDEINGYLDKLMWYSDETSYGFTDMTSALATMTSSGGDIEKLIPMIEGVANATAFAGKGAAEFSTVMKYGINQAYSMGYMLTKDWMSIENATVNSKQLIQALIAAGEEIGTIEKGAVTLENFRTSLADKWLTSEVMETGFGQFSKVTEEIYEGIESGLFKNYADGLEQIGDKYGEVALRAAASSQEAKTFTEAIDATKDAVSSGWMNTFELIFGDYEKAKVLWTDLAETLYDVFAAGGEIRNWILEIALNFTKPWNKIMETLESSGFGKIKDLADSIGDATDKLEYFQDIVNKVWRGDYNNAGDNPGRFELLEKAGYNAEVVQELVNKGYQYQLTIEDVEAAHKKFGLTLETTTEETQKTVDATNEAASAFENLTDEQLEQAGLTEEEIALYKAMRKEADRLGISISDLAKEMSENDGRALLIDSFKNLGSILLDIGNIAKEAWKTIFNPPGVEEIAVRLYGIIKSFNEFTESIRLTNKETGKLTEAGEKFQRIFNGVFAVIDIITDIIGGALSAAFEILGEIFGDTNTSILDVGASIGDSLVVFRDLITESNLITNAFNALVKVAKKVINTVKRWIKAFTDIPVVSKLIEDIKQVFSDINSDANEGTDNIKKWVGAFDGLSVVNKILNKVGEAVEWVGEVVEAGINIFGAWFEVFKETEGVQHLIEGVTDLIDAFEKLFSGELDAKGFATALGKALGEITASIPEMAIQIGKDFIAGFSNGLSEGIGEVISDIVEFCLNFVGAFAEALGVQSPSWKAYEIICDFFQGAINAIADMLEPLLSALEPVGDAIVNVFKSFWSYITDENGDIDWNKLVVGGITIESLVILNKFAEAMQTLSGALTSFSGIFSSIKGVFTALSTTIKEVGNAVKWDLTANAVMKMAIAVGILAAAIFVLAKIDDIGKLWNAVGVIFVLALIVAGLALVMTQLGSASIQFSAAEKKLDVSGMKTTLLQLGIALLLMAATVKIIGSMKANEAEQGLNALIAMMTGLMIFMFAMGKISNFAGDVSKFSDMMTEMAVAMLLMAVVVKLVGKLEKDEMIKGAEFAAAFMIFVIAIGRVAGKANENVAKVGWMAIQLSVAMALLVGVCKLVNKLSAEEMLKGAAFAAAFVIFVKALVKATKIGNKQKLAEVGGVVLGAGAAMLLMAAACKIVSSLSWGEIAKGLACVVAFGLVLAGLISLLKISKKEQMGKVAGSLIGASIAILIMAGAAVILSMIPIEDLWKGVAIVALFGVIMAAMAKSLQGANNVQLSIKAMAMCIVMMAAAVIALSFLETTDLVACTTAMLLLMGMLTLMIRSLGKLDAKKVPTGALIALMGVLLILGGVIVVMSHLMKDSATAVAAAESLSMVILAFAAAFKLMDKVKINKSVRSTLLSMTLCMAGLGAILVVMSALPHNSSMIENAVSLGILINCLATALKILDGAKINKSVADNISTMGFCMAGLGFILGVMSAFPHASSMIENAVSLGILINCLASAMLILNNVKLSKTVTDKLYTMSFCIAILGGVLAIMSLLPHASSMIENAVSLGILINCLASAMLILNNVKLSKTVTDKLYTMSFCMAILGGVLAVMSLLPHASSMIENAVSLGILINCLASAMLIMSFAKLSKTVTDNLLLMSVCMVILGGVLAVMSLLPHASSMIENAVSLGILINCLASAMLIMSFAKLSKTVTDNLLLMSVCMVILGGVLAIMSAFPHASSMIENAVSLGILINCLASAMLIASLAGPNAGPAASAMLVMAGALAIVGLVVGLLVGLDVAPSIETALALSVLMLALSAACLIVSMIPAGAGLTGALELAKFLGVMALVVAAAGAISLIPGVDTLLAGGGDVLGLIGQAIGNFVGGIISGIAGAMISLIPQLGMALSAFAEGVQPFIALVSGIDGSVVAGAGWLTAAILCLTTADFLSGMANITTGGSFASLGADLCTFGMYASEFFSMISGVDASAVTAAGNVATMLLTLTAADVLDSLTSWLTGGVNYEEMGTDLNAFGEAVVEFSNTISGKVDVAAVEAATRAGELLVALQEAIPKSGGLIQDIFGEHDFSAFAEACKKFATCILEINETLSQEGFEIQEEKFQQLATAGTLFSDLNNAIPKSEGWLQDVIGKQDLKKFGVTVKAFAESILEINKTLSDENLVIQEAKLDQLTTAGTKFSDLNHALPKSDGWLQDVVGENDLGKFGNSVKHFANCLVTVNAALTQEGFAVNLDGMEDLKQAGLKMNELQESLPKTGGWWQSVAGSSDLEDFGDGISAFAEAIVDFSTQGAGLNVEGIDLALTAAERLKSFMSSLKDMDYSGVEAFTGVGTGGFGADGPAYDIACAIAKFGDTVAGIDTEAVTVSVTAAKKLKSLIASLVRLDTSGIENFKPEAIGTQMKTYGEKVAGIDAGIVSSSITSANRLKSFISGLVGLDTSGISNFKPESIGSALKAYGGSVSGTNIGAISSSISAAKQLKNFISSLAGLNTSGVSSFKTAVDQLATVNIAGLVKAFSGASAKLQSAGADMINGLLKGMQSKLSDVTAVSTKITTSANKAITSKASTFVTAGGNLATKLASGISRKKSVVNSAVSTCLSGAVTKIRDKYTAFYNAGSYLVTGFAQGIKDNTWRAEAKVKAMVDATEKVAREALQINSPSKVFREIGSGIPEGFAQGIGMLGGEVKRSVGDMASTAITSTRSAMSTVLEALNSDMDAQPTIRPIIDLSDVQTGVNAISSMFAGTQDIGVQSNLNAINVAMNRKLQNGSNDDIISAINKLNDGLGSNRGDTYNFAGITYDNGDEISEAVQTLVRAAKMGRRV